MLGTYNISEGTEAELSNDSTSAGGQLDGSVGRGRHLSGAGIIDNSQHGREERYGEDVVRICEEANTRNQDGPHVVPAEGGLVDFRQGETTSLVGILDVNLQAGQNGCASVAGGKAGERTHKVVVEVVIRCVTSRGLGHGTARGRLEGGHRDS